MTDAEILKKAIEKAVKNGWSLGQPNMRHLEQDLEEFGNEFDNRDIWPIIFSHDFAKAFWNWNVCSNCGEDQGKCDCERVIVPAWTYHLQQMVLEENPISYLAKFL